MAPRSQSAGKRASVATLPKCFRNCTERMRTIINQQLALTGRDDLKTIRGSWVCNEDGDRAHIRGCSYCWHADHECVIVPGQSACDYCRKHHFGCNANGRGESLLQPVCEALWQSTNHAVTRISTSPRDRREPGCSSARRLVGIP